MAGTYSLLRSSGDRVGQAVQRILGVQGSLDDLKDDLATEYDRWHIRKRELLTQRDRIVAEIQRRQAELLEQKSLRAQAVRLQGDLIRVNADIGSMNRSNTKERTAWESRQAGLGQNIKKLLGQIQTSRRQRMLNLNVTRSRSEAQRKKQGKLQVEILAVNNTIAQLKEDRAKLDGRASKEQDSLLKAMAAVEAKATIVRRQLQSQAKRQWDQKRMGEQARKVVREREKLQELRADCSAQLRRLNDEIAHTAELMQANTAELRQCQNLQAENQMLTGQLNRCRAAALAGQAG